MSYSQTLALEGDGVVGVIITILVNNKAVLPASSASAAELHHTSKLSSGR
jgi:hypothetical protein